MTDENRTKLKEFQIMTNIFIVEADWLLVKGEGGGEAIGSSDDHGEQIRFTFCL